MVMIKSRSNAPTLGENTPQESGPIELQKKPTEEGVQWFVKNPFGMEVFFTEKKDTGAKQQEQLNALINEASIGKLKTVALIFNTLWNFHQEKQKKCPLPMPQRTTNRRGSGSA